MCVTFRKIARAGKNSAGARASRILTRRQQAYKRRGIDPDDFAALARSRTTVWRSDLRAHLASRGLVSVLCARGERERALRQLVRAVQQQRGRAELIARLQGGPARLTTEGGQRRPMLGMHDRLESHA